MSVRATKHCKTLHSTKKQPRQLLSMSDRCPTDTAHDLVHGTSFAQKCTVSNCKHAAHRPMVDKPPWPSGPHVMRTHKPLHGLCELELLASSCSEAHGSIDEDHQHVVIEDSSHRARGGSSARAPMLPDPRGHAWQRLRSGGGLREQPPLARCLLDDC